MAENIKFAFVVTGVNKAKGHDPKTFKNMADVHVKALINRLRTDKHGMGALISKPARVRFIHFSFFDDDVFIKDEFFGEKGNPADRKWRQNSGTIDGISSFVVQSPSLTVLDVYHSVRKAFPRGSVIDLSMYSHGFVEGPVLADTSDRFYLGKNFNDDPSTPMRDPQDRDPRVRTDFFPNMGEDPSKPDQGQNALTEFLGGFAQGGSFRVFGCNVQDVILVGTERVFLRSIAFEVLREAYLLPVVHNTALGRQLRKKQVPPDSSPVTLKMGDEFNNEMDQINKQDPNDQTYSTSVGGVPLDPGLLLTVHYGDEPQLFGSNKTPTVSVPYSSIIKFAARQLLKSYIVSAADGLPGVTCFGAPPGTGGDLDNEGKFQLMNVNRATYGERLDFYDKFLGVSHFEDGAGKQRDYAVFNTATVAAIKNHRDHG